MKDFFDYTLSGLDVKTYLLFRKGYINNVVGLSTSVTSPKHHKVELSGDWVAYEVGMLRMLQFALKTDIKDINSMTSTTSQGLAKGKGIINGRMVFRNTSVDTLSDLKNRILTNKEYKIEVLAPTFGIDFEEDITEAGINESKVSDAQEAGWERMPPFDILMVASDERQIEYPRVMRIKDVKVGTSGSSEGATDTEDNEFCNFLALSGYTPWRTLSSGGAR